MNLQTRHDYGYGICVGEIREHSVERLKKLLELAPKTNAEVQSWFSRQMIADPSWDDYMRYDEVYNLGLVTFLKLVIQEAEGIELTACDDFEGVPYLLYQPSYPWNIPDSERNLTEDTLTAIFQRYVGILTDDAISVDHQSVESSG